MSDHRGTRPSAPRVHHALPVTEAIYDLAEGVVWDDERQLVRWVDIWQGHVLAGQLRGNRLVVVEDVAIGQTAGAVALAEDGGQLVAAARGLATISPAGAVSFGPDILGDRTNVRLNDGAADMFGSFVVGSLTIGGDTGGDQLLRVSPDGELEVLREGVRLSNGVAWSPDGNTIYHVDTYAMTVSSHSYGFGPFDTDEPWVTVLDGADLPAYPDGLVVDSSGALWVAQFGGASVRRHSPTRELLEVVSVNAGQVTCPAFVGPTLDRLAIASGRENLESITDETGAIFIADVAATGLPTHRWAGSTSSPYWLPQESEER